MLVFMTCCLAALINKSTTFSFAVTSVNPGLDGAHQRRTRVSEAVWKLLRCALLAASEGKRLFLTSWLPLPFTALSFSHQVLEESRHHSRKMWRMGNTGTSNYTKMYPASFQEKDQSWFPDWCQTLLSWKEKDFSHHSKVYSYLEKVS